jgi:hypothetical protein
VHRPIQRIRRTKHDAAVPGSDEPAVAERDSEEGPDRPGRTLAPIDSIR